MNTREQPEHAAGSLAPLEAEDRNGVLGMVERWTRNENAIEIVKRLLHRFESTGNAPIHLGDALAFAKEIGANSTDALLALARLEATGLVHREFVDHTKEPSVPLGWNQVLDQLGGREGLAGGGWRDGAGKIEVRWIPGKAGRP